MNPTPISLVEAIARMEGFGKPGTRASRNHNPGNMNYGAFAVKHGAIGCDDGGYAVFPNVETGFQALQILLKTSYKGMTFDAALRKYCPPTDRRATPRIDNVDPNHTLAYIMNVCHWCGVKATDVIDGHLSLTISA
jgi:hypothetical protein